MKFKLYVSYLTAILLTIVSILFTPSCNRSVQVTNSEKFHYPPFGKNVYVFDPGMDMKEIQILIDSIHQEQVKPGSEFNNNRFALLFKPGVYPLEIKVGYYMQVAGLGKNPGDVQINGAVKSLTTSHGNVLTNFWRSAENLTILPEPGSVNVWGVSQAAPMRRVWIKGDLQLFDKGYASGGFLADSKIEGKISSGPQQQWLTRNSEFSEWEGGVWNMMFVGVPNPPEENWPEKPYTTIDKTPVVREKPFLSWNKNTGYTINIPEIKNNSSGVEWANPDKQYRSVNVRKFYIAHPETDNSSSINNALKKGRYLLLTPGRYYLDESLKVTRPGTVITGLGFATLIPQKGNPAVEIADIDGVIVSGITIDAGPVYSKSLFIAGESGADKSHSSNPLFLYDIFFRVGGPSEGSAGSCLTINSNDVIIDHVWLWRADHGHGVGWDRNRCANGLIVNGDNVTVYGLFNEHFQEYQTLWNGNNGRVYFYQSEMPYDPPSREAWKHNGTYGYASYKVASHVKNHEAWGLGIYNVFYDAPVIVDNAIEVPEIIEKNIHHKIIFWLNGNEESEVKSIINGKGGGVNALNRKAVMK